MLAGIAQQQRSGMDRLGGRRLSAMRECQTGGLPGMDELGGDPCFRHA